MADRASTAWSRLVEFESVLPNEMDTLIAAYHQVLIELLAADPYPFDNDLRSRLPKAAGIFRIFKRGSGWQDSIYVGQSENLQRQIYGRHYAGNQSMSTLKRRLLGEFTDEKAIKIFLATHCCVQFKEVPDDSDRISLQHFAIALLKPVYNEPCFFKCSGNS